VILSKGTGNPIVLAGYTCRKGPAEVPCELGPRTFRLDLGDIRGEIGYCPRPR